MAKENWFEDWFGSPYYRILYQHRDDLEAREFVDALTGYLQPLPGSRMVDIACGEGRFATELAAKGYDTVGIDLSLTSIEHAKAHENDHLHFYVHDMRFPFYINYFDYAFNFFTSFGYFKQARDNQMAAKSFAACLKKNGILVMDYLNLEHVMAKLVPEETVYRGSYAFEITRRVDHQHIIKDIRFRDADGKERHYTERVAAFGLSDFVKIFRNAGLSLVGTFGNYQLDAYNPLESPRLVMIFKK